MEQSVFCVHRRRKLIAAANGHSRSGFRVVPEYFSWHAKPACFVPEAPIAKVCWLQMLQELKAFAVGIPRVDCKAHHDKKCLLRKIWDNAKLGRVVTVEGDN